jgi:hypothetical protein
MRNTCILYSHRDSSDGSRRFLNSEEVVHRQFRHDMGRYQKKYNINTAADPAKERRKSSSATQAAVAMANGKEGQIVVPIVPPPPSLKRLPLSDSMQTLFEVSIGFLSIDYGLLILKCVACTFLTLNHHSLPAFPGGLYRVLRPSCRPHRAH